MSGGVMEGKSYKVKCLGAGKMCRGNGECMGMVVGEGAGEDGLFST